MTTVVKVEDWAVQRNLIEGSSPVRQLTKTVEEVSELMLAIEEWDKDMAIDAIGDVLVTLIIEAMHAKSKFFHKLDYEKEPNINLKYDIPSVLTDRAMRFTYHIMDYVNDMYRSLLPSKNGLFKSQFDDHAGRIVEELNGVAYQFDVTLGECLEVAYEEIKDRKGKMVSGVFVKDA